ncbi:MAG: cell division protein FtsL [Paracoccaceae bacterium]
MRGFIYVMAFLGLLGLGAWAYSENYDMRAQERQIAELQAEIGALRDAISTQRAEWAYLSRPERLRELVNLNFDRLELMPMEPAQLGSANAVAYPMPSADELLPPGLLLDLSQSVSVAATLNADPEDTAP